MSRNPVVLPCRHIFCLSCLEEHLQRNCTCPVCLESLPQNFHPLANGDLMYGPLYIALKSSFLTACDCLYSDAGKTYREFRHCSIAFFMELISVHSFSGTASQPPEQDLMCMLMELDVQGPLSTRPFSPFYKDSIDASPVVRSFILQLLLKIKSVT